MLSFRGEPGMRARLQRSSVSLLGFDPERPTAGDTAHPEARVVHYVELPRPVETDAVERGEGVLAARRGRRERECVRTLVDVPGPERAARELARRWQSVEGSRRRA